MPKSYNPEHSKDFFDEDAQPLPPSEREVAWQMIGSSNWFKVVLLFFAKIALAFALGASFSTINPLGAGVFLADLLPFALPTSMQDISVAALVNLALGGLAVILPAALWHYALKDGVLSNPRAYFEGNPVRIAVASLLVLSYLLTVSLEFMAMISRVDESTNTGPIPVLGEQPEIWPQIIASFALVLGTCLMGLTHAALMRSLRNRYGH